MFPNWRTRPRRSGSNWRNIVFTLIGTQKDEGKAHACATDYVSQQRCLDKSPGRIGLMRDIASIIVGIAVGLAWLVLWEGLVLVPGVPFLKQTAEDRASRRERLKRMGKLK